jgi:ABC-type glycerol-3-phosphate transport system substrate-binding protein
MAILLLAAVGVLAAAACGSDDSDGSALRPSPPAATGTAQVKLTQSNDQGGVEIDVTWVTPETLDKLDSEGARS